MLATPCAPLHDEPFLLAKSHWLYRGVVGSVSYLQAYINKHTHTYIYLYVYSQALKYNVQVSQGPLARTDHKPSRLSNPGIAQRQHMQI